jgi:hypothetical protein
VRGASGVRRGLLLAGLLGAGMAGELPAQRAQWTDIIYVPGHWAGSRLVPRRTADPGSDSLALVMRVDYFSAPPRWRAELRRTTDGQTLGTPEILVGEGARALVVTPLGTTPLAQHALGQDPMVRALVVFDRSGRRQGPVSGRFVERGAEGGVARVVFRRAVRNPSFDTSLLNPGGRSAGRTLLASGIASVGDQRSASVVATAGARGVDKVHTPNGEVPVTPDSAAVKRMDRYAVGAIALEDFMRAGGLGPYAPTQSDSTGRQP